MSFGKGRVRPISTPKPPPPDATEGNRRWSMRRSMSSPGLVWPGGSSPTIPCLIADMSATGARLQMQSGWVNPFRGSMSVSQQLVLIMRFDRMQVPCEIVRIEDNEIGVRFIGPKSPMETKTALSRTAPRAKLQRH